MANRLSPLRIGMPTLPPIPYPGQTNFHEWIAQVYVELELYFGKMKDQLVDSRGFLLVDRQTVMDGFIVEPTGQSVDLFHGGPVVSSTVTAIASGVHEQQLVITNAGGDPLTIKGGAQVTPEVDVVLGALEAATFRWDAHNKVWVRIKIV